MAFDFTIIIPAYNVGEYIKVSLDFALSQLGDTGEIIVVDDGSTDRTLDVVTGLLKGVTAATVITGPNGGVSVARNKGIRAARGKYLHFLDSDDWFLPDAISSIMERAAQTDADIVYSNVRMLQERTKKIHEKFVCRSSTEGSVSKVFARLPRTPIHGRAFKKSFLDAHNISFPEGMMREDFVFNHTTLAFAEKVAALDKFTYLYRKRGDNTSLSQQTLTEKGLRDRFRQIEMTQGATLFPPLKSRFPKQNLKRTEFQTRLMTHHLAFFPNVERPIQERALAQFKEFLQKHWDDVEKNVSEPTLEVYKAILRGEVDGVVSLLKMHAANAKLTSKNKNLDKALLKLKADNKNLSAEISKQPKTIVEMHKELLQLKSELHEINKSPVRHAAAVTYKKFRPRPAVTRSPAK